MSAKSVFSGKLTLSITAAILLSLHSVSQIPQIAWEKQFQVNAPHYFSDVRELPGENFIVLGAISSHGEQGFNIWLLKCNSQGDTLKTFVYRNPGNDIPMKVAIRGDEGFIVSFMNGSREDGFTSCLLAADADLNVEWTKTTDQPSLLEKADIAIRNDGNIWWMNCFPGTSGKPVISVWNLDMKGNKLSEYIYEDTDPLHGYGIYSLPDGSAGIIGQVQPPRGNPSVMVLRIAIDGQLIWKSLIPQTDRVLTPQCLCCSSGNTLMVGGWAGMCYNPDVPEEEQIWDYDYLLIKLDAAGKMIWNRHFNREGSEKGTAVVVLADESILAAGRCETSFTGSIGPWLMHVDKDGNMIKDQVYKYRFVNDQVARIIQTTDGGFMMVGPGFIQTGHKLSGWMKKLNPVM